MKIKKIIVSSLIIITAFIIYTGENFFKSNGESRTAISMERKLLLESKPISISNSSVPRQNGSVNQQFNQTQIEAINEFVGVNHSQDTVTTSQGIEIKHNGKYKHALVIKVNDKKIEKIEIGPNGIGESK